MITLTSARWSTRIVELASVFTFKSYNNYHFTFQKVKGTVDVQHSLHHLLENTIVKNTSAAQCFSFFMLHAVFKVDATIVPTKSDSDIIFYLQLLSKTLT